MNINEIRKKIFTEVYQKNRALENAKIRKK